MDISETNLLDFISCVKQHSMYDFSEYSPNSLSRRIDKVLNDNSLSFEGLLQKIQSDECFTESVMKQITVNTTELFRDTQLWHDILYKLLPQFEAQESIKIWHAGCSMGLEVYSMAMLLHEMNLLEKTQIYASDLNQDVLYHAIKGEYNIRYLEDFQKAFDKAIKENPYDSDLRDVPFEKYFEINKKKELLLIKEPIKNKPIFRKHDLVKMENIFYTKFDIIFCRNVLIYFNNDLQKKVFEFFHKNLVDKGYLLLGMQESIAWFMGNMFERRGSFYKKIHTDI